MRRSVSLWNTASSRGGGSGATEIRGGKARRSALAGNGGDGSVTALAAVSAELLGKSYSLWRPYLPAEALVDALLALALGVPRASRGKGTQKQKYDWEAESDGEP